MAAPVTSESTSIPRLQAPGPRLELATLSLSCGIFGTEKGRPWRAVTGVCSPFLSTVQHTLAQPETSHFFASSLSYMNYASITDGPKVMFFSYRSPFCVRHFMSRVLVEPDNVCGTERREGTHLAF